MAKKTVEELVQWFDDHEEATRDARILSERDRDYYDNKQLTSAEESEMDKRGQPKTVFNRIAPKIDFMLGMESERRNAPKARPKTDVEDGGADACTDVVRYIMQANDWNQERSDCGEDLFIEGTCGIEVKVKEDKHNGGMKVVLERVPWDRLFWDPRSRFHDFRDAKYFGVVMWMDLDDALELWPKKKAIIEMSATMSQGSTDETTDDRPHFGVWSDHRGGRERVKVSQIWYVLGETWYSATYTKAGFFEEPEVSPYIDDELESIPGLLIQSVKVDRDNDRYGVARSLISPQEVVNKSFSKSLHLLNMTQVIAEEGAVEDEDKARAELAKPDGYVAVRPEAEFKIRETRDMSNGQFNIMKEALGQIDAIGANAALTGKDPREHSGKALDRRQQSGVIELARVYDRFRAWQIRVYKAAWFRARQFWDDKKVIRVTDDERNTRYFNINEPMTMKDRLEHQGHVLPPMEQLSPEIQQQLAQPAGMKFELASMHIDIEMDDSADTITLQNEQFEQLTSLLGSLGGALPPATIMLMLKLIIEASGLRSKKQLGEMLESGGVTPEQQQETAQEQQIMKQIAMQNAQLDMAKKAADIEKTKSSAMKDMSEAQKNVQDAINDGATEQLRRLGIETGDAQ